MINGGVRLKKDVDWEVLDILMDMIEDGIVEKMPIDGGYTYVTSNLEEEL